MQIVDEPHPFEVVVVSLHTARIQVISVEIRYDLPSLSRRGIAVFLITTPLIHPSRLSRLRGGLDLGVIIRKKAIFLPASSMRCVIVSVELSWALLR